MVRLSLGVAAFCLLLTGVSAAFAQSAAYIVVDAGSGMVLGQRDADKVWYPASVTKLMTAYLTFQALKTGQLKMTSPVIESANALAEPPSKMGFAVGTSMTVDNALKMLLVHSANDIAVALAEAVAGSEARFVGQMNGTARSLGMSSTHYDNPNGLPSPGQLTTARDLAVLARALLQQYPDYRDYFRIPAIKAGRRILRSQNALLERYPGATGMKTGFICDSGFNTVVTATREGRTLIVVVLGATTAVARAELAAKLLNIGFMGGSFGFPRVELASFHAGGSTGPAVNMHDAVCGRHRRHPAEADLELGDVGASLGPAIATMPPVVVYTGQTDPGAIVARADAGMGVSVDVSQVPAKKTKMMPLPRIRPAHIAKPAGAARPAKSIVVKAATPTLQ
jgi:D-alanyl-D-alanine carboxypeptidase